MNLLSIHLHCPDTLGDVTLSFANDEASIRPLTLIFGGPGSGKTTLAAAIGNTRPGHTAAINPRASEPRCYAECNWFFGMDDPERAQALVLRSPNAPEAFGSQTLSERRDVALAERLAREGGFACLLFSALRWFSKSPLVLRAPARSEGRYELRVREPLEDATKHDLSPDVKQALAYAAVAQALPQTGAERYQPLGDAMACVVSALAGLGELHYAGLDPRTLEPRFLDPAARSFGFDALPTYLKHCIAFGALAVRALWSAYPGIDPRRAEAVVVIDEVDLHQDTPTAAALIDTLREQLPQVQWILTTRSSALLAGRDASETLALRQLESKGSISVHVGADAQVH